MAKDKVENQENTTFDFGVRALMSLEKLSEFAADVIKYKDYTDDITIEIGVRDKELLNTFNESLYYRTKANGNSLVHEVSEVDVNISGILFKFKYHEDNT